MMFILANMLYMLYIFTLLALFKKNCLDEYVFPEQFCFTVNFKLFGVVINIIHDNLIII